MSKIPVSVCIIAKNEEKHMENCLSRLKKYDVEVIVTDTGSTDKTREIAEKYADKVLDFPWNNDFSAARNFCAQHASNNWILVLDCDEYVSSIDVRILRIVMQKYPKDTGIIRLKNLVNDRNGEKGYATEDVTRFYNKNYYTFIGAIHEQILYKDEGKRAREEVINSFLLPMEVVHHGYALTEAEMQAKQKRNMDLLRASAEADPDNAYYDFQLGQSEMVLGHLDEAIEHFENGLAKQEDMEYTYMEVLVRSLAKCYTGKKRLEDALALMEKYKDTCKSAKYHYTYATIMLDSGQRLKALALFLKVVSLPDTATLGQNLLLCYGHIIGIYKALGDYDMAALFEKQYEACREEKERILNS